MATVSEKSPADPAPRPIPPERPNPPQAAPIDTAADRDVILLEGPHSRWSELQLILVAVRDFISAFRALHFVGPCVTVFGSARTPEAHPAYAMARAVGAGLTRLGFTVMTGGGPGIMEAANRGAREAGGRSVGCAIRLPNEQGVNQYMDRFVLCDYFFVRKTLLLKYSYAFVAMPGGLGTLDELFEALTLIQTGKVRNFPVVLMGVDYWAPLCAQLDVMVRERTIDARDLDLLLVTDDVEAALTYINERTVKPFGLITRRVRRPSKMLRESALGGRG
ncbi:MAG: TIGR00730 family Rossman fold protein [Vicinamibacteraceae bacterium]